MGEKVKVSRELAKAIEIATATNDESYLLWLHHDIQRTGSGWEVGYPGCGPLGEIPTIEFAEILINGYEIEKTPEEKLTEWYLSLNQTWGYHLDGEVEAKIAVETIDKTLEILGIKIKGIND